MQQLTPRQEDPPWLKTMISLLGIRETPGDAATPMIIEFHKWTTLGKALAASDETPWCSSCMNYCLGKNNFEYTKSAAARSWERYGHALPKPARGAIAVLSRGADIAFGHVSLILDWDDRALTLIGGNQGNSVSVRTYARNRLVTMRWPQSYPIPQFN